MQTAEGVPGAEHWWLLMLDELVAALAGWLLRWLLCWAAALAAAESSQHTRAGQPLSTATINGLLHTF